jgi:hypothetical protein
MKFGDTYDYLAIWQLVERTCVSILHRSMPQRLSIHILLCSTNENIPAFDISCYPPPEFPSADLSSRILLAHRDEDHRLS